MVVDDIEHDNCDSKLSSIDGGRRTNESPTSNILILDNCNNGIKRNGCSNKCDISSNPKRTQ